MKKSCLTGLFLLASVFSISAFSNNQMDRFQGGFTGAEEGLFLVESVLDAGLFSDETPVRLTGFILTALGNQLYTFEDDSGSIIVEIEDKIWFGLRVDAKTKIIIRGEINFEFHEKLVRVHSVRLAQ